MLAETTSRRFPPPWTVEETAPCFIVRDANGGRSHIVCWHRRRLGTQCVEGATRQWVIQLDAKEAAY